MKKIKEKLKYQLFFEILDKNDIKYIQRKNIVFINQSFCHLDFSNKNYNRLGIPNINIKGTLILSNINCNELILNKIKASHIHISKSEINELKFNSSNSSARSFSYFCTNDKYGLITIPPNIKFDEIKIKSNKTWEIMNNKYLYHLGLYNVNINKFHKYNSLWSITLTDIDLNKVNFSGMGSLKNIYYESTKIQDTIKFSNIKSLLELDIKTTQKSNIELENLPKLSYLLINYKQKIKKTNNCIDLGKINSKQLRVLIVSDFTVKNISECSSRVLGLNIYSDSPNFVRGKRISMLLNDNTFDFFLNNNDGAKINIFSFKEMSNINKEKLKIISEFLMLRKSTPLMEKLLKNDLKKITDNDLETINQKDLKGATAISYCNTKEAVELISKYKKNKTINLI